MASVMVLINAASKEKGDIVGFDALCSRPRRS